MSSKNFLNPVYNIEFLDLYHHEGLLKVHQSFLNYLQKNFLDIFNNYHQKNAENSQYLIDLAKVLEFFLIDFFQINDENNLLKKQYEDFKNICLAKREYVQRYIAKKYSIQDLEKILTFSHQKILEKWQISSANIFIVESELAKKMLENIVDEELEKYAIWAMFSKDGQKFHQQGTLFILPKKIDINNLIPDFLPRQREGFDLTDHGYSLLRIASEVNYCIYCHNQKKDSCRTGLHDKTTNKIKVDELGLELEGCPLDQKISEMNFLKNINFNLASLAMAIIDNPMIAGTGHRICNDCMKACIYQKQEPVDIPQIESRILKDVLSLPYGFEIYSLLTRWNPLNINHILQKKNSGKKILVCGLGPAGFTLSHYLLNSGHEVVAIDGLKIEPLDAKISGVDWQKNRHNFLPIKNIEELYEPLSNRIIAGFGGVAEYGITSRFDKNYLKIIRLLLERRENFSMFGGLRFGSSITDNVAFEEYGFDHIALCTGAGRPQFLELKNNFAKGVRLASDFLMAMQLTGAYQKNLFTNLQIRQPIIVVGGGLTAVDSATEAKEYYKVQIEKFAKKIEKFKQQNTFENFWKSLNDEEKSIAEEFLQDYQNISSQKFSSKILYRKKIQESPAYRLNHLELKKAMEEGVEFVENHQILEIILDKFNHICAVRTSQNQILPCKTLLMAIGTMPNISYVLEDGLKLENDGKYLKQNLDKDFLLNKNNQKFSLINTVDENLRAISFFGDLHPQYEGNVVRAMASAKIGSVQINKLFDKSTNINANSQNINKYKNYKEDFLVNIVKIDRLSNHVVEIFVKSKLLAQQTSIGQIFRLHNYQTLAREIDGQRLAMEGVVVTALSVDKESGIISGIVVETGGSSSLIKNFVPNEPCVFMGPSGKPTEIPVNETVVLIGGGRGNQPLTALAEVFKANNCKVIFFAGYKKIEYIVRHERMKSATDSLIIAIENEMVDESIFFSGTIIEAIKNYFTKNHQKTDRVFAIGNDNLMHEIARLRNENIVKEFALAKYSITSLNSPMQCMMKGVCGQCLQRIKNPDGTYKYFYSCANQDQMSDQLDFDNLHARCQQNSLLEKLTKFWIEDLQKGVF
jgi:NADPH-dependent glutamate synthase beta subunit-like oxidoreductase/NAD(P)H-flavin reductase